MSDIVDYLYTHNINQLNQSFISIKYYFQYFLFFVVPPLTWPIYNGTKGLNLVQLILALKNDQC